MKKTTILLLAAAALAVASCSKGGSSAPSGYSCICHLSYLGKDTIITFTYSGISRDSAVASCNYETTWAHSITGPSGSNCDFVQ